MSRRHPSRPGHGPALRPAVLGLVAALAGPACVVPGDEVYDPVDTEAPALEAVLPVPDAEGVPPEAPILLAFSEPVLPETVRVTLESGPLATSAAPLRGDGRSPVLLAPREPLAPGVVWTARLDGSVSDRHLNTLGDDAVWRFRTGPAEAPFEVVEVIPRDGAVRVPLDVVVNVALSRPVHEAMVGTDDVRIEDETGLRVPARVELEPASEEGAVGDVLRVTPARTLSPGTAYVVTVSADLIDVSARRLGAPFVSGFETEP